jgi:hypothetical protein
MSSVVQGTSAKRIPKIICTEGSGTVHGCGMVSAYARSTCAEDLEWYFSMIYYARRYGCGLRRVVSYILCNVAGVGNIGSILLYCCK